MHADCLERKTVGLPLRLWGRATALNRAVPPAYIVEVDAGCTALPCSCKCCPRTALFLVCAHVSCWLSVVLKAEVPVLDFSGRYQMWQSPPVLLPLGVQAI
jgi:hypothetical protein